MYNICSVGGSFYNDELLTPKLLSRGYHVGRENE